MNSAAVSPRASRLQDAPSISLDVLLKLSVVLPDLATQREIADVMMRLENHGQALRRQLELAQEIRRDILNGLLADAARHQ